MKKPLFVLTLILLLFGPATLAENGPGDSGASESETKAPVANLGDAMKAQQALTEIIHAYESGNTLLIQGRIDPSMIGYQRFLDGMIQDMNLMKQINVHLFDTQTTVGPDVAVIQTGWEKRFLSSANFAPGIFSGRTTFLLHRDGNSWKIASMVGDNPFSGQSGTLGQLTVSPLSISASCSVLGCPNINITLDDPDLSGLATTTVEILTSKGGDREIVTMTATTPGHLTGSIGTIVGPGQPVTQLNNRVEMSSLPPMPATITIRYYDQNPGNNRPPSYVVRTIIVS